LAFAWCSFRVTIVFPCRALMLMLIAHNPSAGRSARRSDAGCRRKFAAAGRASSRRQKRQVGASGGG
jgi:hypothetical protein